MISWKCAIALKLLNNTTNAFVPNRFFLALTFHRMHYSVILHNNTGMSQMSPCIGNSIYILPFEVQL